MNPAQTAPAQDGACQGEDGPISPIGFDDTPPWHTDLSTTNGDKSVALVPYKKGWAMWNKYRGRVRYVWNPRWKLYMPSA